MKTILFISIAILTAITTSFAQDLLASTNPEVSSLLRLKVITPYEDSILKARDAHDRQFTAEILNEEEAKAFDGFCYFPVDSMYRVTAIFTPKKGKKFVMPMTKERDRSVYYRAAGTVTFTVNDTLCSLKVYENLDLKHNRAFRNYLFLPFRDGTTAVTTYGGGRFLDVHKTKTGTIIIDFNGAYHPYCVYSERYSCPIPPAENLIVPKISAGECYEGQH